MGVCACWDRVGGGGTEEGHSIRTLYRGKETVDDLTFPVNQKHGGSLSSVFSGMLESSLS